MNPRSTENDLGLRENLNKKPIIGVSITLAIIIAAIGVIVWQNRPESAYVGNRVFYSDDDGKTWFPDQPNRVPPFDHNGKDAVRCYVYKSNGESFAAYLQKFSKSVAAKVKGNQPMGDAEVTAGTLVKRPGDADWIPSSDPRAAAIMSPKNPKNPSEPLTAVMP
jgi:hypothetical protein